MFEDDKTWNTKSNLILLKVTIILAGYKDDIEKSLFAFNPGMTSRFTEVMFDDYTENELVQIWRLLCKDRQWTCTDEVIQRHNLCGSLHKRCAFFRLAL